MIFIHHNTQDSLQTFSRPRFHDPCVSQEIMYEATEGQGEP